MMQYLTAKDLKTSNEKMAETTWNILQEIKGLIEIGRSSPTKIPNSVFISPEDCGVSMIKLKQVLEEFQKKGVIKILKKTKPKDSHSFISIKITDKQKFNSEYEDFQTEMTPIPDGEPKFDPQTRVLTCGNITHPFQRGRKDGGLCKLFPRLWEDRQRKSISGKILKPGKEFPVYALPKNLDMTKQQVNDALKSIRRILKKKRFPIELSVKNGVQLVVTTKKKK